MATKSADDQQYRRATSSSPRSPGRSPRRATSTTPRSPGRSPTRRATSVTPRSPGRSPTRSSGSSASRRSSGSPSENMFSKAIQSLFLVAGVVILSSFFFGGRWGPALIGVGVFLSAFPPVRRHFDRWLVGTTRGEEADQAAVLRMAAGGFICIAAIVFFR